MKTLFVTLLVVSMLALAACGGAGTPTTNAPSGNSLGMCAPGVTDCVDVVIEDGNVVQNPHPVTDAVYTGTDAGGRELLFTMWMGVEPCDFIDRVEVVETATTVDVQIFRASDPAATCVAMAIERTVIAPLDAPLGDRVVTLAGLPVSA